MAHDRDRRFLMSLLTLAPFAGMLSAAPAAAQTGATLPPIVQPPEKTKAGFLARARALREQAVKEGDQAWRQRRNARTARPQGTDLEIAYGLAGDDLIIRVNKGGAQVFRVVLEGASKQVSERELLNFSSASPDFVHKIGPTGEAIANAGYRLGQVAGKVMKAIRKS